MAISLTGLQKYIVLRQSNVARIPSRRVIFGVLMVAAITLGVGVGAWFALHPFLGYIPSLLGFCGMLVAGMLAGQACLEWIHLYGQRGRDLRANKLAAALNAGEGATERFVLYLRPFASTDRIDTYTAQTFEIQGAQPGMVSHGLAPQRMEFERQVEEALRPFGLLVGLGRPLEHLGAGRIQISDEDWKMTIRRLMDAADLIVLLPSARGGTIWEVDQLLESGAIAKTIVIDPPNPPDAVADGFDLAAEWANIREAFAGHGYDLPPDNPRGVQIYFGDQKTPIKQTDLPFSSQGPLKSLARQVTQNKLMAPKRSVRGNEHA